MHAKKKMALPVIPEDSIVEYQRDTVCIMIDTNIFDDINIIDNDKIYRNIILIFVVMIKIVIIATLVMTFIH